MTEEPDRVPLKVGTTGFLLLADGDGAMVATELVYRPHDCLAVRLTLLGPDGMEVTWTFAWELLATGLTVPAGHGDITVRPLPGPLPGVEVALLALTTTRLWLPGNDVAGFVGRVRHRFAVDARRITSALDRELAAITTGG